MDHKDTEFLGHPSLSAMDAALFGNVPRIGASPGRERDYRVSIPSSRNLPIRGVSDSASQKAQAQDVAETSTSSPRNLPIRGVSDSASQRAQARYPDFSLNVDSPVWEMARTFPLRGTPKSASEDCLVEASIQRYADEICSTPFLLQRGPVHSMRVWRFVAIRERQVVTLGIRFKKQLCIHCGQPRHIRRNCPRHHPKKTHARTSPPNGVV
jgi:hypothetical protein